MAMWPAFALLAAGLLETGTPRIGSFGIAGILAAALGACLLAQGISRGTAPVADRATALLTVTKFGADVWAGLAGIAVASLVPAIACALGAGFWRRGSNALLAFCGLSVGVGAVAGTARVAPYFSLGGAAREIREFAEGGFRIAFDGEVDTASSLLFYADAPIYLVGGEPPPAFLAAADQPEFRPGEETFRKLWGGGAPVIFAVESGRLEEWSLVPAPRVVARSGTMLIVSNRDQPPNGATTSKP